MPRKSLIDGFQASVLSGHGDKPGYKLAGWSSSSSQTERFKALIRMINYEGGTVVDFGCGPGDLYAFLRDLGKPLNYVGVDQNLTMVDVARSRHGNHFRRIEIDAIDFDSVDYVFASGIFQFFDAEAPQYHFSLTERLFSVCKKGLAVNFLSAQRSIAHKVRSELYLEPEVVCRFAAEVTKFWALDHSYHSGGGDMTLTLLKRRIDDNWVRPNT